MDKKDGVKDGEKNAFDEVKADEAEGRFSISQFAWASLPYMQVQGTNSVLPSIKDSFFPHLYVPGVEND